MAHAACCLLAAWCQRPGLFSESLFLRAWRLARAAKRGGRGGSRAARQRTREAGRGRGPFMAFKNWSAPLLLLARLPFALQLINAFYNTPLRCALRLHAIYLLCHVACKKKSKQRARANENLGPPQSGQGARCCLLAGLLTAAATRRWRRRPLTAQLCPLCCFSLHCWLGGGGQSSPVSAGGDKLPGGVPPGSMKNGRMATKNFCCK